MAEETVHVHSEAVHVHVHEGGAIRDILDRRGVLDRKAVRNGKVLLVRIVAMLTRMIGRRNQVREGDVVYGNGYGYGNGCGYGYGS